MEGQNITAIAHLKCDYETWEKIFLEHEDNRVQVDAGNVLYGKANDQTAIIVMKNVDMEMMARRASDPEFQKFVEPYVDHHEFFIMSPMQPPKS